MTDKVNEPAPTRAARAARVPGGATQATRTESSTERVWLLTWGRQSRNAIGGGIVGALIVGALALVVALIALTIAIGRTPPDAAADQRPTAPTTSAPAGPTTFVSPEQTGKRWTVDPIITGVPQHQPSYEPTPTPTPTPSEEEEEASEEPTTGEATVGVTVVAPPGTQQAPQGEGSVMGRNPDRPGGP